LLKNFQSTPQPLPGICSQNNQTLPGNKKTRSVSDSFNRNEEKPVNTSDVNPLRHLTQTVPPATDPDQPDSAQKISIGYAIAIENHFRINQTLIKKFQPDFEFIFLTRLCLKKNNQTMLKKFQPDFEFIFLTRLCLKKNNQTMLKKFQPDFEFIFLIRHCLKKNNQTLIKKM